MPVITTLLDMLPLPILVAVQLTPPATLPPDRTRAAERGPSAV